MLQWPSPTPKPEEWARKLFPSVDGLRLQVFKPDFGISLQGQSERSHVDVIMFYLKKVREMLKGLYMFLNSQVFGLSVELGEVLVIFHGKIMEDRR